MARSRRGNWVLFNRRGLGDASPRKGLDLVILFERSDYIVRLIVLIVVGGDDSLALAAGSLARRRQNSVDFYRGLVATLCE